MAIAVLDRARGNTMKRSIALDIILGLSLALAASVLAPARVAAPSAPAAPPASLRGMER